jgi:hypothetical protein
MTPNWVGRPLDGKRIFHPSDGGHNVCRRRWGSGRIAFVAGWLATFMVAGTAGASPPNEAAVHSPVVTSSSSIRHSPTTSPHLNYYGGPVISDVQVQQVLYGSGTYEPEVVSQLPTFFGGITNSAYMDWLGEYDTNVAGGTDQFIGRGTFGSQSTITPSPGNDGKPVDDSNIQAELVLQLQAGHLPAPVVDAGGNVNTVYAVYFPAGQRVTLQGGESGVNFCVYHSTLSYHGLDVPYIVMPDFGPGSGDDAGCGSGTEFENVMSYSAAELIGSITDTDVGLDTTIGPPLAWFDPVNGDSGLICNQQQATISVGGNTWTVQRAFSNVHSGCIATGANPNANAFSLLLSPSRLVIPPGRSNTVTVSARATQGNSQSIALSVTGLPPGVTGSFQPSTVTPGSNSVLTLTVAKGASSGTGTFTVTGVGVSSTETATASVTVEPALVISPSKGPAGSSVSVTGAGFQPGEAIAGVTYDATSTSKSKICANVTVASDGTFSCSGQIPSGAQAGALGEHKIKAVGATSRIKATTVFKLT